MDRSHLPAVSLSVAVLIATLTACSTPSMSAPVDTPSTNSPSTTSTAGAAPSPTSSDLGTPVPPASEPEPAHGDIISFARLEALLAGGWSTDGVYRLDDDHFVVTDPTLALPQTVADDIQQRLDAIGFDDPDDNGSSASANWDAEREILADIAQTGKNAVTLRLRRMAVPNADGTTGGFRWVATSSQYGWWMQWDTDRDALQSRVQSWIDENTAPGTWVVFVGPGERIVAE